ncbi:MAG: hypothetical protein HY057_06470 [Rhodospirillales bacterium]|nr:hypothetical protein [Rhodospirillales bacterium]
MANCLEYATQTTQECSQYADQGHNECAAWRAECCDWWPCSWLCEIVSWFCDAWYWVANVVCVAWVVVTTVVCVVWDVATTIINAIVETIASTIGWIFDAIAFLVELIFSIPILGRLLRWLWGIILTVVSFIAGLFDSLAWIIGIRPEKKLRVCVIVLRDEADNVVANLDTVKNNLQAAVDIYRDQANVRVIKSAPFQYDSGFAGAETVDDSWLHVMGSSSAADILDVGCDTSAAGEDLWVPGTKFEFLSAVYCFFQNSRKVLGYGAPITVFVVRSVGDTATAGCSMGPLNDYVTIEGRNPVCIAHEMGHSCSLWHVDEGGNLMNPVCGGTQIAWWQAVLLRASRHVSYF